MGKWIGNKYHEDEEGDEECGRSRSGFSGYASMKDIEEQEGEQNEERYDKRINTGRPSQPFLDCSSMSAWCKKNNTFIKTVQKIVQQLTEQGIEITKENIFKQRDFNRHNAQAFRKDRANTNVKQISAVTQTGKANCGRVAGGCRFESGTADHDKVEKEEVKKDDDIMKQDDNVSVANAIKETANNAGGNNTNNQVSIPPEAFEFLLDAIVERRVKEGIATSKCMKFLELVINVGQVVVFILSFIAFSLLMTILCLSKYGFIKAVIN